MKKLSLLSLFAVLSLFASGQTPTPLSVDITLYLSGGISNPIGIEFLENRMFIIEQGGKIKMAENGSLLAGTYLDISSETSGGNEQGLLGLAFDPDFENNRTLYVNYTNNAGNTVISSLIADNDNLFVDPNTENILLTISQPFGNHNGGQIAFGPDGYLYIGMGDGGSGGDPGDRSQNPQELLGKMLRIDVTADGYTIPPSNPFVDDDFTLDEIWAFGVRNPWRFSFDQLTGDLWIGDVGQQNYEEIDFQAANSIGGENYGWRCYEGFNEFNTAGCGDISAYDFPVFEYTHNDGSCSVTGGYVYRSNDSELLNGIYIYIDYCSGILRGIGDVIQDPMVTYVFENLGFGYTSFGQDPNGGMYLANSNGIIYEVEDPCHSQIPELVFENNILTVEEGANYYWYLNDVLIEGENNNTFSPAENGDYFCVVENEFGCNIQSNTVTVIGVGIMDNTTPAFNIYPNPFKSSIFIEGDIQNISGLRLSDAVGKVIWEQQNFISNPVLLPIDIEAGLYILRINTSQSNYYSSKIYKY